MTEVAALVGRELLGAGINYRFGEIKQPHVRYPYWIGEIHCDPPETEDGEQDATVFLTGWCRGDAMYSTLTADADKIRRHFRDGITVITDEGTAIAVYYAGSTQIPTPDDGVATMQITLTAKCWEGR